ncbi:MAG: formyltransferase family protein [Crocinitomicaceae bacterium]
MIKKRLAIFASGSGSNALNLVDFFANHAEIEIGILISNKKEAPVVEACERLGLDVFVLDNEKVSQANVLSSICQNQGIDFVILAGYLRKIPDEFIAEYPNRIINIHPSLLPNFGGPGMYGMRVHQAVKESGKNNTGISIHLVNQEYDKGQLIAQFYCSVDNADTSEMIAKKVQILEHTYFPTVVENYIKLL